LVVFTLVLTPGHFELISKLTSGYKTYWIHTSS